MWHVWGKRDHRFLVVKSEGKRTLGRPGLRWEEDTVGWGRDRWRAVVNSVMNLRVA